MTTRFSFAEREPRSIESLPLVGRTSTRRDGALSIGEERTMFSFFIKHTMVALTPREWALRASPAGFPSRSWRIGPVVIVRWHKPFKPLGQ